MFEPNRWQGLRTRVSRRRALQLGALGGAGLAGAAYLGCGGGDDDGDEVRDGTPDAPGQPRAGGTLRASLPFITTLDPTTATSFLPHALASYVYSRLYRFKTVAGELAPEDFYTVVPELAESNENPDPLTYTFTLNPNAVWQSVDPINPPGRPVTAEDVVYSYNRYRDLSPNRGNFDMVESIEASADGRQVTFHLNQPYGLFINRIASYQDLWILPHELIETDGDASMRMVGSGPFLFDQGRFRADVGVFYPKNPNYWETDANGNQLPYVDEAQILIIPDKNQELSQFQAGQVDTMFVPPLLAEDFRSSNPDASLNEAMRNILNFFYFEQAAYQANQPPFNDERVRRALSLAVNRDDLLDIASPSLGEYANVINAGMGAWWLDPRGPDIGDGGQWYQFNVEEARSLLSAAGFEDGFDAPMHFSSNVYNIVVPYYDLGRQAVPQMLAEAGIRVQDRPEDYISQYLPNTFTAGQFDGMAFGLESVFSDVGLYFTNMFYPRPPEGGGGRNHSAVDDPELVSMIQRLTEEQDLDAIREQGFEIQRYVSERMYYVPLITPIEFTGDQPWLMNVQNTTGPTTYGVGTEAAMHVWIGEGQQT